MEKTPQRPKRGPYRQYLRDIYSPMPKTTRWRSNKRLFPAASFWCSTPSQIQAAEDMLVAFYVLLPELYGNAFCTINSHLLIHLPKYVRLWGPLWTHSAFGFESFNGHITSMITSKYKIAEQLLYSIEVSNTLGLLTEKLEAEQTLKFLNLRLKCYRRNMSQLVPGTYSVGLFSSVSEGEHVLIQQFFRCESVEVHSFYRLYHNDILYYSMQYGREGGKRNSTVCYYCKRLESSKNLFQLLHLSLWLWLLHSKCP